MQLLVTPADINDNLVRLIATCSSCQIAVAWASTATKAFDLLRAHHDKIKRMVVGTHFYQTDPTFMETFTQNPNVKFVRSTNGVFHPKLYFFSHPDNSWECVIGSPNFTAGGLGKNEEVACLLTNSDDGASNASIAIMSALDRYWEMSTYMTATQLEAYQQAWRRKRLTLRNLSGEFGEPNDGDSDNGVHPLNVGILQMSWGTFFSKVKSERIAAIGPSMDARLKVVQAAMELFEEHKRFDKVPLEGRKKIAGLLKTRESDYRLFGSMAMTRQFKAAVNSEDERLSGLSRALEAIPFAGGVARDDYLEYISRFSDSFPEGGAGLATATRLLAMKRPDTFVCVDRKNEAAICKSFRIKMKRKQKYEQYWDSIIERIRQEAVWWSSPKPHEHLEQLVWQARTAFLDSHFYTE